MVVLAVVLVALVDPVLVPAAVGDLPVWEVLEVVAAAAVAVLVVVVDAEVAVVAAVAAVAAGGNEL